MKTRVFILIIMSAILSFASLLPAADRTVELKLNLPKGLKASTTIEWDSNSVIVVSPSPNAVANVNDSSKKIIKQSLRQEYLIECIDVDANNIMTIKQTLKATKIRNQYGQYVNEYDSADTQDKDPGVFGFFQSLINESLTFHMAPDGNIIEVIDAQILADKICDKLKDSKHIPPDLEAEKARWLDMFRNERIRAVPAFYPAGPVSVGQSWITPACSSKILCPTLDVASDTWTLKKIIDGIAHLQITGKYVDNSLQPPFDPGRKTIISHIETNSISDAYIDIQTGLVISQDTNSINKFKLTDQSIDPNVADVQTTIQSTIGKLKMKTIVHHAEKETEK